MLKAEDSVWCDLSLSIEPLASPRVGMSAMLPDEATLCTLTVLKGIGPLRLLAAALESSNRFWEDLARNFFCVAGRGLFLGSCGAFAEERGC